MKYRISPRGVLEINDEILFIVYKDPKGALFYALPGGSQKTGDDLRTTLKREFLEETSLEIESHEVIMVREFMLETSDFEFWKDGVHQVEIIFRCTLTNSNQIATPGPLPDIGMLGLKWLNKNKLKGLNVYPTEDLKEILEQKNITYLFN